MTGKWQAAPTPKHVCDVPEVTAEPYHKVWECECGVPYIAFFFGDKWHLERMFGR